MISFEVSSEWTPAHVDAVAEFLERLVYSIHRDLPVDAYFCTACVHEQLHLPLHGDLVFLDQYRQENPEDRLDLDWSPAQLGAVMGVVRVIDRDLCALLHALVASDDTPTPVGAQLELNLQSRPPRPRSTWGPIPF